MSPPRRRFHAHVRRVFTLNTARICRHACGCGEAKTTRKQCVPTSSRGSSGSCSGTVAAAADAGDMMTWARVLGLGRGSPRIIRREAARTEPSRGRSARPQPSPTTSGDEGSCRRGQNKKERWGGGLPASLPPLCGAGAGAGAGRGGGRNKDERGRRHVWKDPLLHPPTPRCQ